MTCQRRVTLLSETQNALSELAANATWNHKEERSKGGLNTQRGLWLQLVHCTLVRPCPQIWRTGEREQERERVWVQVDFCTEELLLQDGIKYISQVSKSREQPGTTA